MSEKITAELRGYAPKNISQHKSALININLHSTLNGVKIKNWPLWIYDGALWRKELLSELTKDYQNSATMSNSETNQIRSKSFVDGQSNLPGLLQRKVSSHQKKKKSKAGAMDEKSISG